MCRDCNCAISEFQIWVLTHVIKSAEHQLQIHPCEIATRARGAARRADEYWPRPDETAPPPQHEQLIQNDLSFHHHILSLIPVNLLSTLTNCALFAWITVSFTRTKILYIKLCSSIHHPPFTTDHLNWSHHQPLDTFDFSINDALPKLIVVFYAAKPLQIGDKEKKQTFDPRDTEIF